VPQPSAALPLRRGPALAWGKKQYCIWPAYMIQLYSIGRKADRGVFSFECSVFSMNRNTEHLQPRAEGGTCAGRQSVFICVDLWTTAHPQISQMRPDRAGGGGMKGERWGWPRIEDGRNTDKNSLFSRLPHVRPSFPCSIRVSSVAPPSERPAGHFGARKGASRTRTPQDV